MTGMHDKPVIIMAAPNGARKTKRDHPALPVTIEETALEAARCRAAGACALHAHVRDENGEHILDAGLYRQLLSQVKRNAPDMLVQITTEAVGRYTPQQQADCVRALTPEMISMALAEMAPPDQDLGFARDFYFWAREAGVHVQHILYSAEDLARFLDLKKRGVIPEQDACVLFVLGRYSRGLESAPADLAPFLSIDGADSLDWFVCAFGKQEHACLEAALTRGGHIRVGFENNLYLSSGELAENSADLVENASRTAREMHRRVVDPAGCRELLGIRS